MISRGKQFETLNGLRGVAAMVVVAFHWFGGLTNGYLAVDFFYVLSGFVIAYAYGNRLRNGLSLRGFLAIRLIRLYPLYLFGTVLSTLVLAASFAVKGEIIPAEMASFHSLPFALLMAPTPPHCAGACQCRAVPARCAGVVTVFRNRNQSCLCGIVPSLECSDTYCAHRCVRCDDALALGCAWHTVRRWWN